MTIMKGQKQIPNWTPKWPRNYKRPKARRPDDDAPSLRKLARPTDSGLKLGLSDNTSERMTAWGLHRMSLLGVQGLSKEFCNHGSCEVKQPLSLSCSTWERKQFIFFAATPTSWMLRDPKQCTGSPPSGWRSVQCGDGWWSHTFLYR